MSKASGFIKPAIRPLCAALIVAASAAGCASRPSASSSAGSTPPSPPPKVSSAVSATPGATSDGAMSGAQQLGVSLINALVGSPGLKSGTSISVGTSQSTVTLNGFVSSAAQKQLASAIARKQAPRYTILNQLVVRPGAKPGVKPGVKPRAGRSS